MAEPLLPSGNPFEDLFTGLVSESSTSACLQTCSNQVPYLSTLDQILSSAVNLAHNLQDVEEAMNNCTSILFAAIGGYYGYTNIPEWAYFASSM
jgi:hypothetical protein